MQAFHHVPSCTRKSRRRNAVAERLEHVASLQHAPEINRPTSPHVFRVCNSSVRLVLARPARSNTMEEQAIGWIAAIIIGGIAGWLAEQFMKSQMGLVMNIVLGIVGAAVASWLFGLLGISFGPGWLGYLIAGFIGAIIL